MRSDLRSLRERIRQVEAGGHRDTPLRRAYNRKLQAHRDRAAHLSGGGGGIKFFDNLNKTQAEHTDSLRQHAQELKTQAEELKTQAEELTTQAEELTTQAGFIKKNTKMIENHQGFITKQFPERMEQNKTHIEGIRDIVNNLLGHNTQLLKKQDEKIKKQDEKIERQTELIKRTLDYIIVPLVTRVDNLYDHNTQNRKNITKLLRHNSSVAADT